MNLTDLPTNLPKPEQDGACDHLLNSTIPDISLPTQDDNLLKLNDAPKSNDASDALAIAICYMFQNRLGEL